MEPVDRPKNEEAEQNLIGALLLNNDIVARLDFLQGDHFSVPVHGRIFEAIRDISFRGGTADPITLKSFFEDDPSLDDVGGAAYLARMASSVGNVKNAAAYGATIHDLFLRRSLIDYAEDIVDHVRDADVDAARHVERAEAELFALTRGHMRGEAVGIGTAFDKMLDEAERNYRGEVVPVMMGLRELDRVLDGLMPGDLTLMAGRPGMGKTAAGLHVAIHNARAGRPVAFLQLEMTDRQLSARTASVITGIPAKRIARGQMTRDEWQQVIDAGQEIRDLPLFLDDRPGVHIDQIIARARAMKRKHGIELLVVDYLGLIRFDHHKSRVDGTTDVSQRMKELARILDIHNLCLHQLSRKVEERPDKRPILSDLRDTGSLEQDADNVVFLYRHEYYEQRRKVDPTNDAAYDQWLHELARCKGDAELIVAKQRMGETGTAMARFNPVAMSFYDADE